MINNHSKHLEGVSDKFLLCFRIIITIIITSCHRLLPLLLGKAKELGLLLKVWCISAVLAHAFYQQAHQTHEVCKAAWGISRHGVPCKCEVLAHATKWFRAAWEGGSAGAGRSAGSKADGREAGETGQLWQHHRRWGFPGAESMTRIDFKEPLVAPM